MPTTVLSDVIAGIDRLRADVLATPAEGTDPGHWRHLRDQALGELTAGLPATDCAVCIAHAPRIPDTGDANTSADSRGRLLSWLSGAREQLRIGRAVADMLARGRTRSTL
ncbi:hypothetical protein ACQEVB_24395 [Pseudonocardia sp. CA-107938]|uniref:hypothetical protein n=1 Tax=Pseudonocardia sp. CA-107938 TaxID=3240021 RepID=UPI003D8EA510